MDIRNVDSRLQHLRHGPQLPPGPDWSEAVRSRPQVPGEAPTQGKPAADPATVAPHAAPAERQIILSQQPIAEALRELKLPETPQNAMIAQALAQMDQPVSAQNMNLVREALRGLAMANGDDVAAAVILLMHDLPVTPAGVAAVRQLMHGPALPDQLARLGSQLTNLLGQLDLTSRQLTALGLQGPTPGQPPVAPPPGSVAGAPLPLNVMPPAAQAAAASAQAAAMSLSDSLGDTAGEFTVAGSGDEAQESGETEGADGSGKSSGTGAAGSASLTGTGSRRENAEISRALGGAIGRMTSDQTEGVGQSPTAGASPGAEMPGGEPEAKAGLPTGAGGRGEQMAQQQGSGQGRPSGGSSQTTGDSDAHVTLEQLAAKAATTSPKLNIGGNRQPMPDAPLPPGMSPAGGSQAGSGSATSQASSPAGQGTAGNGAAPPSSQAGTGQANMAPSRLNVGALGAAPPTAMAAAATGKAFVPPPDGSGLAAKLAPAMQLLKSADLATTVREPAHLPQQVAALKAVFRELPGALLSVEKELRDFAADPRVIADIPLPELESLLAKAVGKHAGTVLDAQDEGLLRQLFEDLRKVMTAAGGSLHETLGHLHAREQITQSTNVMCLPLALPGPPPRPVELLVEPDPDDEQRRRQGGSPTHMRLSIDTHHMGRVGIDLVSWQEKLSIKLQVSDPKVQSLIADHLEQLDKALARNGFVTPDLSVAVAPAEQRASMLLPERKYTRSLRRIEGII